MSEKKLSAMLDVLIPAREGIPGAGALGLALAVLDDARATEQQAMLDDLLDQLPDDLEAREPAEREEILRRLESDTPASFGSVVNMAYTAYYTDPRVLRGISERTGYNPGPPQPDGYLLPAFDPELLEPVRNRHPLWRRDA